MGLNFLNLAFLAGLAAAALPILIHLFSRRPVKDVLFPSLEYLREISLKRVRRVRVRQWLLLALRVLIVALFALAMARPALRGDSARVTKGSSTVVILLDNSYSLGAHPPVADLSAAAESEALWVSAQRRAEDVLDMMGEEDKGIVIFTARPVSMPFRTPVANVGLLRQEISKATVSAARSDLPEALEQALQLLQSARTINKELFVISDFQQRDIEEWTRASDGSKRGSMAAWLEFAVSDARADSAASSGPRMFELPEDVQVVLIPLHEKRIDNVTLDRLRFDPAGGQAGVGRLVATISNHSAEAIENRLVQARAAGGEGVGAELQTATVRLPAFGTAEVEMNLTSIPDDGAIEVRLGRDLLEADNHAWIVTSRGGVTRVLVVAGSGDSGLHGARNDGAQDDAGYLRRALDPAERGEFHQVRVVGPDALGDPAGWAADVVVLSNVGRLSEAAVENLARFRARGGGVLIALGDRVDPRYYNTEILSRLTSIEFLNVSQDAVQGSYRSFRPTAQGHAIFEGFAVGPGDDLSSARFRKVVEARVGGGARVLAEWSGRLPALIEDDGVLVLTTSLDGGWNDFVTSASFLPFLHQSIRHLASRGSADQSGSVVGSELETSIEEASFQGPVTCLDPEGGRSVVQASPASPLSRLRSERTSLPGIYRFVDAGGQRVASFAVSLDPAEGDLTPAAPELATRLFGHGAQRLEVGQRITRDLLEGRYGRELWRPLLIAVLLLLAVESILARGRVLA